MNETERLYLLALQHVPMVGDVVAKKLIAHCGSARAVFSEKKRTLLAIDGIGDAICTHLANPLHLHAAEKEYEFIRQNKIACTSFLEEAYPRNLQHCYDSPILLFSKGNLRLAAQKIISVVGTRRATAHGIDFCEQLIAALSPLHPVIVSGFAAGIDIAAHRAAVKNHLQTVGCLAHGLNQFYPRHHAKYAPNIEENGGFITDFWSSSKPDRENFLKRNRIIAGISEATVVIESAERGGSLLTATLANSYDREVFAVPGRPGDERSIGCNNLIKQQKAHLLTSAADLVYMLSWKLEEGKPKPAQKRLFVTLDETETNIYEFLQKNGKALLDDIALSCRLPIHKTATTLLNMELKGVIRPLPGKWFEAI